MLWHFWHQVQILLYNNVVIKLSCYCWVLLHEMLFVFTAVHFTQLWSFLCRLSICISMISARNLVTTLLKFMMVLMILAHYWELNLDVMSDLQPIIQHSVTCSFDLLLILLDRLQALMPFIAHHQVDYLLQNFNIACMWSRHENFVKKLNNGIF